MLIQIVFFLNFKVYFKKNYAHLRFTANINKYFYFFKNYQFVELFQNIICSCYKCFKLH